MNWLGWSLLAAFFAGVTAVLAKVGVSDVNANLATAIRTSVILLFAWSIAFLSARPFQLSALSARTWFFLTLSGIATGLSWLCYFRALQLGDVSQVAPVDKLSVVFVVVLAALFLREPISARTGMGVTLMVAGALVLAWKR